MAGCAGVSRSALLLLRKCHIPCDHFSDGGSTAAEPTDRDSPCRHYPCVLGRIIHLPTGLFARMPLRLFPSVGIPRFGPCRRDWLCVRFTLDRRRASRRRSTPFTPYVFKPRTSGRDQFRTCEKLMLVTRVAADTSFVGRRCSRIARHDAWGRLASCNIGSAGNDRLSTPRRLIDHDGACGIRAGNSDRSRHSSAGGADREWC